MTDFNTYNSTTLKKCENYISNNYGDEFVGSQPFPNSLRGKNTNELNWNGRSMNTHTWCNHYIREHTGEWPKFRKFSEREVGVINDVAPPRWGGSTKGGRKQQSKRKNFKLRKVSKKY